MEGHCYLCGMPVAEEASTDDHAVPKQLISRAQPKAKGFDYGGVLPTHAECNNRFGPASVAIHWRYDSVMPDHRRAHVPGGTYFFTVNTYRRRTSLTVADVLWALREAIETLRLTHPFAIELARTRALRPLRSSL
jgi:hypothetical protein